MGIDLTTKSNIVYFANRTSIEGGEQARRWKTDWMLFRRIPAKGAEWYYGSSGPTTPNQQAGTKHYVKFTADYYAAIYEVTQAQWSNVYVNAGISGIATTANPSILTTGEDLPLRPVEHISIAAVRGMVDDGIDWPSTGHTVRAAPKSFLGCLRDYCGVDVDLPTEAQWEYACRAGTGTKYCCGDTWDDRYGWTTANCSGPQPVGTTIPNDWGLYDFHGNVYEPCLDWMDNANYDYPANDNTDPQGPVAPPEGKTPNRCLRGGTWNGGPGLTASYLRGWVLPGHLQANQGLRLFCPSEVK
jgi:formylglycine-generating enzyme required for sulfatase activity